MMGLCSSKQNKTERSPPLVELNGLLNNVKKFAHIGEDCAICCDVMDDIMYIRCGHGFHGHCIFEWIHRKNICPMCKQILDNDNIVYIHY